MKYLPASVKTPRRGKSPAQLEVMKETSKALVSSPSTDTTSTSANMIPPALRAEGRICTTVKKVFVTATEVDAVLLLL